MIRFSVYGYISYMCFDKDVFVYAIKKLSEEMSYVLRW